MYYYQFINLTFSYMKGYGILVFGLIAIFFIASNEQKQFPDALLIEVTPKWVIWKGAIRIQKDSQSKQLIL